MQQVICVAIQKGGTGKTTTAAALADAAVMDGRSVLAIDLDPQANLTYTAGATAGGPGSFEMLEGKPAKSLVQHIRPGFDLIPASEGLSTIKTGPGSARRLQKALEPIKDKYDVIVIDTPPTAGELQYNGLQASTALVIPLQADVYGLQGLYQMIEAARSIQRSNPALNLAGIVITQYDGRSTISKQMRQIIIDKAAALGVPHIGTVRAAAAVREAAAMQRSLFDYAPKSKPAADYATIYQALKRGIDK